ncbi:MAG: hypothetical protein P8016_08985 [Sedimentisphaerales bacterium]
MKKIILTASVLFLIAGCDTLRFAPSQIQKQNVWLHNRTMEVTSEEARAEGASQKLQALTELGELQSRAFVSYYGLPEKFPLADTAEDILSESNIKISDAALHESSQRPDGWQVADSAIDLGIGILALLGGVYGTQAARFLRNAKTKSKALKEIIAGNELFKQQNASSVTAFKEAHANQSSETRQIVTEMKVAS